MRIELIGLSKSFSRGVIVLKPLDFCADVSTLAIIGPSGDGKSTLLRILGGLLSPTAGRLIVDHEEVTGEEGVLLTHRRRIGFVFQQGGLFKHMTAMQNITVPLIKVHGLTQGAAEARGMELLTRFGLGRAADKKPAALSGGEQQRIAIARAIAPKPKMLLLDEPTSALDPEYTTEVLDMINELKQEGMDFIIVTHEMGFARSACEKAAFLYAGQLLEYGDSEQLFANPGTEELRRFLSKLLVWRV